jgi:signal transduction histidine kinase
MPLSTPQTRQLYRAIAQHFPKGTIAAYNRDLEYIAIDGQLVRNQGIDPESFTGKKIGWTMATEEEQAELQSHARSVFDDEQFHIEHEFQNHYYKFDFVPVKIEGQVSFGMLVVQDTTDQMLMQHSLASALEQTKDALAVRDNFLAVAAHELKTPLTTIMGFTQLLASRVRDRLDDREQRMLQTSLIQQARLNGMINALLDMARLERGALSLETAAMDVVVLVREIVGEMRVVSDRHTFLEEYVGSSTIIEGDQDRLEQVFRNLYTNAIKYSPEGGTISTCVRRLGNQVTITVSDNGMGIPGSELSHIFEQFARGSNLTGTTNTQISGMGIGLYVSREIVHKHSGAIYAHSDGPGEGSVFTVVIPLRRSVHAA